jgi:protocatechuate 3,4-dioxygenase alpha subunit
MATQKTGRAPSQTIGPFFHNGLKWQETTVLSVDGAQPNTTLFGKLTDGEHNPVTDAMIEFYAPTFATGTNSLHRPHGLARCATDRNGIYRLHFTMPEAIEPATPPHLHVMIFARGLLTPLYTHVYFADSVDQLANCAVVRALKPKARAQTLLATKDKSAYSWSIRLQGEGETVFLTRH